MKVTGEAIWRLQVVPWHAPAVKWDGNCWRVRDQIITCLSVAASRLLHICLCCVRHMRHVYILWQH